MADGLNITGSCQCGAVHYAAQSSLKLRSYACHCTECQSQTGSAFALQIWLLAHELQIQGEVIEGNRIKPNGDAVSIFACPVCFSRIYSKNSSRPQFVVLRAGTLDDSARFVPDFHIWTRSKQPWINIPEGACAIETQAGSAEEWTRLLMPSAS